MPFRRAALVALRKAVMENEAKINAALQADLGKGSTESYMCETGMVLSGLRHAIRHIRSYSRPRKVHTPLAQFPARSYMIPEPYGNVLVMSPWNYPLLLSLAPAASAIAAGNTVIIKPSAYSPATSAVVASIIRSVSSSVSRRTGSVGRSLRRAASQACLRKISATGTLII